MQRFIVRRVLQSLVVLVVLALVVFALARVTGNPADLLLPEDATRADREHLLKALGLDRPVHEQLGRFLAGALHGDLGQLDSLPEARRRDLLRAPAEHAGAGAHRAPRRRGRGHSRSGSWPRCIGGR